MSEIFQIIPDIGIVELIVLATAWTIHVLSRHAVRLILGAMAIRKANPSQVPDVMNSLSEWNTRSSKKRT